MADRTVNININYKFNTVETNKQEAATKAAQKATDDLTKSAKKAGDTSTKAGNDASKSWLSFSNVIKAISFTIVAQQLFSFTKQVIEIRGEFQKFEAVLTNTLGSKSQALIALARINEFAKTTPFSVKELTENFIKLANRGVQPTIVQMRAIGDLAATLGKDFSQVTEAILDINNPERWKEIGIQSETAGNKVKLTFRGVTEEVDRTVEGVTKAVTALGQLNGVAGSTAAISATLSGQVSNLGDAWDQLLNTIGQGNEGILSTAISKLSDLLTLANEALKGPVQIQKELESKIFSDQLENFKKFAEGFDSLEAALVAYRSELDKNIEKINAQSDAEQKLANQEITFMTQIKGVAGEIRKQKEEASKRLAQLNTEYLIYDQQVIPVLQEYIKTVNEKAEADRKASAAERSNLLMDRRKEKVDDDFFKIKTLKADLDNSTLKSVVGDIQSKFDTIFAENPIEFSPVIEMDNIDKFMQQWSETWKDYLSQGIDDTANYLIANEQAEVDSLQRRMDSIRNFYDEQYLLAGDNERAKKELRIKEERETAQLQREIAMREWKAKRNSVIINTAAGVAQNIAIYPYPYWILPVAFTVAKGAAELSALEKAKPGFKSGVIDLKGPGSDTSDSIEAKLSRGESVITARATRQSKGLLEMIQNNKIDDRILKGIDFSGGRTAFNEDKIVKAIQSQNYPKSPDLVLQGRQIYEVYEAKKNHRKFIRSKSI